MHMLNMAQFGFVCIFRVSMIFLKNSRWPELSKIPVLEGNTEPAQGTDDMGDPPRDDVCK